MRPDDGTPTLYPTRPEARDRRWVTGLAGAYLVLLYLALCSILGVFGYVRRDRIPGIEQYFPSLTPTVTSTPHLIAHQSDAPNAMMKEGFSVNWREWSAYYLFSKVELLNGKMFVQSNQTGSSALAICGKPGIAIQNGKYYIQADVATDAYSILPYGLAFGMDKDSGDYYVFMILPELQEYELLKHRSRGSDTLLPFTRASAIRPFPQTNTLSVYFDHGSIELYINGALASTQRDAAPYSGTSFGAYIDGPGVRLIVNNYFVFANK